MNFAFVFPGQGSQSVGMIVISICFFLNGQRFIYSRSVRVACRYVVILIVFQNDVLSVVNVICCFGATAVGAIAADGVLHNGLFDSSAEGIIGEC